MEQTLARLWEGLLGVDRIGRDDNFFELGGHSLLVLKAVLTINRRVASTLKVTDIYNSPTIRELARRIAGATSKDEFVDLPSEAVLEESVVATGGARRHPAHGMLLTGGTGFVGRFLLAQLLARTDATIYCLVRASSQQQALSRLKMNLSAWDLWDAQFERRVVPIAGDLRLPRLGIRGVDYQLLADNVDSIYHCATSMNHLESYAMARSANVDSARELVRLAASVRPKLINYVSTLGVFSGLGADAQRVVDENHCIDGERHLRSSGYTASKWVSEKIFLTAAQRGIRCNIFRLGLVWADSSAGATTSCSANTGYSRAACCPATESATIGMTLHRYRLTTWHTRSSLWRACSATVAGIFHIAEQDRTIEDVFERCNEIAGTALCLVPLYDWICHMRQRHREGYVLPVVPLIEYAFSMDEGSFHEQQLRRRAAKVRFDCARTRQLLERAGVALAASGDDLLNVFVNALSAQASMCPELGSQSASAYEMGIQSRRSHPGVRASS